MTESDLLRTSRREATRMRAVATALPSDGMVRMARDQFLGLAALIDALAAHADARDADDFHAAVDGVRWWVPLPEVERDRAELARLRAERERLDLEVMRHRRVC